MSKKIIFGKLRTAKNLTKPNPIAVLVVTFTLSDHTNEPRCTLYMIIKLNTFGDSITCNSSMLHVLKHKATLHLHETLLIIKIFIFVCNWWIIANPVTYHHLSLGSFNHQT